MGYAAVHHQNDPPDWEGPTGFYHTDRQSLPEPAQSRSWDTLYFWAFPSYVGETMFVSFLADATVCRDQAHRVAPPPTDRRYLLELLRLPEGVVGAPPVGTVWILPVGPLYTLEFPTFRTTDGLEGYQFAFTITRVTSLPGDFDRDGDVDQTDADQFALCYTGPNGGPIGPGCGPGDFDSDGDIDCDDWDLFTEAWTEPGPPPPPPNEQCMMAIPTVSEWGLVAMTLLVLCAGTVVLLRRNMSWA